MTNETNISVAPNQDTGAADAKFDPIIRLPGRFAAINRMVIRDLNKNPRSPSFMKHSKSDVARFLKNPYSNEKSLRDAVIYLYGASSHFRRLIQYFASLSDKAYVVSPYKLDVTTAKADVVRRNFRKVLNLLGSMDLKNQLENMLVVCLREDIFYGTIIETADCVSIKQLPSDYCKIAIIEDNVLNVSFDFNYFMVYPEYLDLYPDEFRVKFDLYRKDMSHLRWQELDAPYSFAIKANKEILDYAIPPFAGILREVYDLEDYKDLKLTKAELENYALLVMTLGVNDKGEWKLDYKKAVEFYRNLDSVVPEEVGTVLSPMPIDKISFERNHTGDTDAVAEAEEELFTAAGVSSLIFSNNKASANALLLSIKADQALTYSIVTSIETMLNRFIHRHSYGRYFKMTILDCSPFNRKEVGDAYLKACTYGMPLVSYYCASQGLMQDEMDGMNFLEDDVLGIKERFKPLQSSATQSSNSDSDGAQGRPPADMDDLTESGVRLREEA